MDGKAAPSFLPLLAVTAFAAAWVAAFALLRWLFPVYIALSALALATKASRGRKRGKRRRRREILDALERGETTPREAARELERCRS